MKSIRIGAGLGFYGDNWEPVVASIERGGVQFIASDHLAELTLAILQKDRQRDPALGYARDVVPMLLRLWPLMQPRGVRFVCNAGGLNPRGAAQALLAAFAAKGLQARVAVISGDDVLPQLLETGTSADPFAHLFTGAPVAGVRERLVFANAYLGAAPIAQALDAGADIVITGRVADAALFLGPLVHSLGWTLAGATTAADLNRLAQGLTVGHLLECSGQGSGGNFGSQGAWQAIPDLAHIGYPIAEVWEDGRALITKAPGTGGRINFDTVRQQLLYEVHNPHAYFSPDVVLDMGNIQLEDEGQDCVRLTGARGTAAPDTLKVVAGYRDGHKAEVTWGFSWPDAWDKALAAQATIRTLLADRHIPFDELYVEYPGLNSAHGALAPLPDAASLNHVNEVWTRMVLRTPSKAAADGFGRLFPWIGLSGPAYTCGFTGLHNTSELLGIWPTLVPRQAVEAGVKLELLGSADPVAAPQRGPHLAQERVKGEARSQAARPRSPAPTTTSHAGTVRIPLARIAHARSGDKADWVDFGLFAWDAAGYRLLEREVTAARVQAHFAPWLPGEVECWYLPNILAIKLVLHDALQGGGARNLRLDNLGKAMAGALLRLEIEVTSDELEEVLNAPGVGWWGESRA
ncbi:MAG TPA: acyclic terpene utilization AtuA family protein [Hydrogenophaga sp.]|nr:acyclic terpene utilization AtuA family protein [Hydrogenophaga sp.]